MEKIVIIGAGEFQLPLIKRARELNYETHVFAWEEGAVGKEYSDYFYPISITEKEKILELCKKISPSAVTTIATDLGYITATFLCNELGLTGNKWCDVKKQTNKYEMRLAMKKAGIKVPGFIAIDEISEGYTLPIPYPVIVKPTDRSGSRGINKVVKNEELLTAVKKAADQSFEHRAIIEEFIEGQEYSMECISFKGKHYFLAATKKYTTGYPNYIEKAHVEPSGLSKEMEEHIQRVVFKALDALGIENGASHSEFRINSREEIILMEIGARMGGDCIGSHLVNISTGYDYLHMVLSVALGQEPKIVNKNEEEYAAISFLFTVRDYENLVRIQMEYPEMIVEKYIDSNTSEKAVIDSGSRHGYYILKAPSSKRILEVLALDN